MWIIIVLDHYGGRTLIIDLVSRQPFMLKAAENTDGIERPIVAANNVAAMR